MNQTYKIGKSCPGTCVHKSCKLFKEIASRVCLSCTTVIGDQAKYIVLRGEFFHAGCKETNVSDWMTGK